MPQGTLRVDVSDSALRTEHERLLRTTLRRGDALAVSEAPPVDASKYSASAIEAARSLWRRRLIQEHQSAAVFSRLLPQLIEAEAPLEYKTTVLRMSMDELHHAAICGDVLTALGVPPEVNTELRTEPLPDHADATPAESVLRNIMFVCCLSETFAVAITAEEREQAREPVIQAAIDRIHSDETLHARFGWIYLAHALPTLGEEALARTNAYLAQAFAYLEKKELEAMPRTAPFAESLIAECSALGVSDTASARELFYETIENVIVPGLQKLGLDATTAWDGRNRTR